MTPETLPLKNIQLIEASAGTGKTWTIAALYVRLILGHGDDHTRFAKPLLPRDILVVTFTDAATAELRERIRKRLTEAARFFRDPKSPDDAFLKTLRASYRESAWPGLAHRLAVAADGMDEASIFTIHGWCSRMLKQHAFDSGAPFLIEIEGESSTLRKESIRDFWRVVFYPLNEEECRLIQAVVASPDALALKIKDLLKAPPETLERFKTNAVFDTAGFRQALEKHTEQQRRYAAKERAARELWVRERSVIEQILNKAQNAGHLNGGSYQNFPDRLAAFRAWAERGEPLAKENWFKLFSKDGFKLNNAAQGQEPRHAAFDKLAEWIKARKDTEESGTVLHNAVLTLATFWVRDHFAATKTRKATLDYDDLIHKLHAALHRESAGERLAGIIRSQYPVALIDEFQDTDAAQYDIFERIYGPAESSTAWFMIGDPKQAIYSFRGADIHTYLRARQRDGVTHHTLDTNYRSTDDLVRVVNQCFAYANNHKGGAFLFKKDGHDPIPFEAVKAKGRKEQWVRNGQPAPVLTCWYYAPKTDNDVQAVGVGEYQRTLAHHCANAIARLLQESETGFRSNTGIEALKEADIAILIRDRKEAQAIRQALLQRGIRSVYLSNRDSVYDAREARDLLHCLRAFLSPQDGRLIRAALATATLTLTYPDIERLNTDETRLDEYIQHFIRYRELWNTQGVLAAMRQFIMDQALPSRLLARPDGERILTNLLHLSERLQAEGIHRDGPAGLLRYLEDVLGNEGENTDENILRLESDQGLIRVVTIHKSKGLEYPLVFLPFICGFKPIEKSKTSHFKYHDDRGQVTLTMAKGCEDDSAQTKMDNERLQEELRLLYVALTRARHALWLGTAPLKRGNGAANQLQQGALGYLLSGGEAIANEAVRAKLEELLHHPKAAVIVDVEPEQPVHYPPKNNVMEKGEALRIQKRLFSRWWVASYSALSFARHTTATDTPEAAETARFDQGNEEALQAAEVLPSPAPANDTLHGFPAGTEPGVLLHSLLETAASPFYGFNRVAGDAALRTKLIGRIMQRKHYSDWQTRLETWLERFLTTRFTLGNQTLSLSELMAADCVAEMEFWFQASAVDTLILDTVVKTHILPQQTRPELQANTLNGLLKGFIDLVFQHQGRYYVVDYKSNRLGATDADYATPKLNQAMLQHRYDLQYSLYLLALHRYLRSRLRENYDYDRDIGGAVYIFLRGLDNEKTRGIYHHKPPLPLIETLDRLFGPRSSDSPGQSPEGNP